MKTFIAKLNYKNKLTGSIIFIKNKEYKLRRMGQNSNMFECEVANIGFLTGYTRVDRYAIAKDEIFDYFYTAKELRKLKLQKLERSEH